MFYKKRIEKLENEIYFLRGQIRGLRLDWLENNGNYKFNVGQEIEIIDGKFKVQNRGYSDRGEMEGIYPFRRYVEKFVPVYCVVGIDNEDVLYLEELELKKRIVEWDCIKKRLED